MEYSKSKNSKIFPSSANSINSKYIAIQSQSEKNSSELLASNNSENQL